MLNCISFILILLATLSNQKCIHDTLDIKLTEFAEEEAPTNRLLQETLPIRIVAEYAPIANASIAIQDYLKKKLMPAAIQYFTSLLKVSPVTLLKVGSTTTTICGLEIPAIYRTGVEADLVLFVSGGYSDDNFLAWAKPCILASGSKRAVFGQIFFNYNDLIPVDDIEYEEDLLVTMHEITHVLGFSSTLFPYFPSGAVTGYKMINGNNISYLHLEPLTTKLRQYFNCSALVGAYMENQGGVSNVGSHFERRIFNIEYMTASSLSDVRVTEFTLALLEGSGWYDVDYSLAEPMHWGRGAGCAFLNSPCMNKTQPNFDEFCPTLGQAGCTFHGRNGGYCGTKSFSTDTTLDPDYNYWSNNTIVVDTYADNCPYYRPYSNVDCENPLHSSGKLLTTESYGEGSKCFMGTLYPTGALAKKSSYCLQYGCEKQTNGTYFLRMKFGTTSALCKAKGSIAVTGYYGKIDCPDPNEYCTTVGVKYCKRGCMKRGTCNTTTGKCTCNAGWRGIDCSLPA